MIELEKVSVRAGGFMISDVSLNVATNEFAVMMGKTGCGKTTLLESVCGLRTVVSGRIQLCGIEVTRLHPADREVGYVPQDLALFPTLTVREHLAFALQVRGETKMSIADRVRELAELLEISSLLDRRPQGLSGGEAQRVALGRALSFRPKILLLDEPMSALDEETRQSMYTLLRTVQRQTGVTALHVTHSRLEAQALADRLFLVSEGKVCEVPLNASAPERHPED